VLFTALLWAEPPQDGTPPILLTPRSIAAVLEGGRLKVAVNLPAACTPPLRGTLGVELLDPRGAVLAQGRQAVRLSQSIGPVFAFDAPQQDAESVRLRVRFRGDTLTVPLTRALLTVGHEISLSVGREFFALSKAGFRCEVHGVRSLRETVPLAGAAVTIHLRAPDGKTFPAFEGLTNIDGAVEDRLTIPDLPPGSYQLEVATRSGLGTQRLTRTVKVRTSARLLVTTDRPLYRPGQRMHLRALALRPYDLAPVALADLTLEVLDGRGNKVFQKSLKTSEYGIAAADFDLAEEVNSGEFRVRACLAEARAERSVTVEPFVLPKFKVGLTADKGYYLRGEVVHADVQADYFFGKPVAGAAVRVRAALGPAEGREFQTWKGATDAAGHARLEVRLPERCPELQPGGEVSVRLTVEVTDSASHKETTTNSVPLCDAALQVSLIPEGGRLVPGLENYVYVVAVRPDGSPARCKVRVRIDKPADQRQVAEVRTDAAGLARFSITPGQGLEIVYVGGMIPIERFDGRTGDLAAGYAIPLKAEARDERGEQAEVRVELPCEPLGENVRLRLDKAVYEGYERPQVEVHSTAGVGLAALEVVKDGQILLHQHLELEDGQASHSLQLPADVAGAIEVHAWQPLPSGEIIRDSRLIYVHPRRALKVKVRTDREEYRPGAEGRIHFDVTDSSGRPAAAALGVLIVDEAMYALQDVRPGLQKAFFTLREEALQAPAQAVFHSSGRPADLVLERDPRDVWHERAEVLFAAVRPVPPARHEIDPVFERRLRLEAQIRHIGAALWFAAQEDDVFLERGAQPGPSRFRPGLLQELVHQTLVDPAALRLPTGERLTLEGLARLEPGFRADRLGIAITRDRLANLARIFCAYCREHEHTLRKGNDWTWGEDGWVFPRGILKQMVRELDLSRQVLLDAWGKPMRLVKLPKKRKDPQGQPQFEYHDLVSAGPDGEFGTEDDVRLGTSEDLLGLAPFWWQSDASLKAQLDESDFRKRNPWTLFTTPFRIPFEMPGRLGGIGGLAGLGGIGGLAGLGGFGGGFGGGFAGAGGFQQLGVGGGLGGGSLPAIASPHPVPVGQPFSAPAPRLREYFPETLLWQPTLITDDRGHAELPVSFADSITTWRLTASASSKGGLLGGVDRPLRVFQDFFVDIDLPVALTQNDEVAFPVAVYNYLKEPQTVKIDLRQEAWFDLLDSQGASRSLDLKPNEVTSVKFRIRAKKVGHFPLTVDARGSKTSDAVKRSIEVLPDGKKFEQVATDRLTGKVTQLVHLPDNAIPDASRLFVKIYPGIISQVLEGAEGLLHLPDG
jgi:hypothetical protein